MAARRRRPVIGSAVKRTPATGAGTIRCTTTASPSARSSTACVVRYDTARSFQSDAQHRRTAFRSAASPSTSRIVSCWPAKLASGRSSAVADERTATRPPSARYASRTAVAISGGTAVSSSRARAPIGSVGSTLAALAAAAYASVVITKASGTGKPARMSSPRLAPFPPATARSCAPSVDSGTTRGPLTRRLVPEARERVATRIARGVLKLDLDLQESVVLRVALAARERAGLDLPALEGEDQRPLRGVLPTRRFLPEPKSAYQTPA